MRRIFLLALLLVSLATSSRAQVLTAICSQAISGASPSCTLTVSPNQVIVFSGTAFAAYGVGDSLGVFSPGLFSHSQSFNDPNSPSHPITTGISVASTGSFSGSDTFTVQETQFPLGGSIVVTQWSGLLSATPDSNVGNTGTAGGSGNITGGNLTTSVSGDLLIAYGMAANNTQTLTVGSGYTQDQNFNYTESVVGTYVVAAAEHKQAGAAGSYAANFTVSASGPWAIVAVALKVASRPHIRSQVY
jgi:hypothetical protein